MCTEFALVPMLLPLEVKREAEVEMDNVLAVSYGSIGGNIDGSVGSRLIETVSQARLS